MNVFCCVIPTSVFKWCSRAVITNIVILVLIVSLSSSWPMPLPWSHWGTTDDFATSFFHFSMFSKCCLLGLGELQACPFSDVVFPPLPLSALSSSPFHCALQDLKMVLVRSDERETWPYHCSLHLFVVVRKPSCGPVADTDNKIATKSVNWISGVWLDQSSDCSGPPGQVLASTPLGFTCPTSVTMMD